MAGVFGVSVEEYKVDKKVDVYIGMQEDGHVRSCVHCGGMVDHALTQVIKRWVIFCPLVGELSDPSMRPALALFL